MYASCRGSEWAQPDQANAHLDTYHRNDFGNAYACTLTDIKLLTLKNHPMTMSAALQTPHLVGRVQIRFEQQITAPITNGASSFVTRKTNASISLQHFSAS